jgi:hypothetical protein
MGSCSSKPGGSDVENARHNNSIVTKFHDGRTTHLATSSTFKKNSTRNSNGTPISARADQSKASFLDLPAELRNHIYSQVLIYDDYIRPTTNVPNLHLLQVCKQLHHEAASIFYAGNSFYCSWYKSAFLDHAPHVHSPATQKLLKDWLQDTIWPARRYHVFLTRVVIDSCFSFAHRGQELQSDKLEDELKERLSQIHIEIATLWAVKDWAWEGRLICYQQRSRMAMSYVSRLSCTLAFAETDEGVTAILVRGYRQLR